MTGAATAHYYRSLAFTNVSGEPCALYGYPGVSFVTAVGGSQVGAAAGRIPADEHPVVLAPGTRARASLVLIDTYAFGPANCPLVAVRWMRVYPPGEITPAYLHFTSLACPGNGPVFVFVGPVAPAD